MHTTSDGRVRRPTLSVDVAGVPVGGGAPIVVQSMTNTDTADVEGTARQVQALSRAGSELVRITVNTSEAAAAVAPIRAWLDRVGVAVPLIGDFHFNGHKLLREHPECAAALAKYRINPGNVGRGSKRDPQFAEMIETACRALSSADATSARRVTTAASCALGCRAFSSIMRASSSGSRLPQFTPMRTGLP